MDLYANTGYATPLDLAKMGALALPRRRDRSANARQITKDLIAALIFAKIIAYTEAFLRVKYFFCYLLKETNYLFFFFFC